MINEETIVSVYNDKMTLLQFLKTVNKALDEAVLTSVEVSKKGNATLSFVFVFADGTKIKSGEIVLQQGESVTDAKIVDGHLYLTLSNDERLDAGNVKPVTRFEINASQHLIVYYGDGTTQDLGAILQGNVNIDGNLTANSIIENMSGYRFEKLTKENAIVDYTYASIVKNGNKITFAVTGKITRTGTIQNNNFSLGRFHFPLAIGEKLFTTTQDNVTALSFDQLSLVKSYTELLNVPCLCIKESNGGFSPVIYDLQKTELNIPYLFRFEITFLLSDNMAV